MNNNFLSRKAEYIDFCESVCAEKGYEIYKNNKFLKISNEVLFFIELDVKKSGFSFWYGCYPLAEKNLWLGAAVVCGHIPSIDEVSFFSSEKQDDFDEISKICEKIFSFFAQRKDLQLIASSISNDSKPYFQYTKAICLLDLERFDEGGELLLDFTNSGLNGEQIEYANEMLISIKDGSIRRYLDESKMENIRKLRLQKYVSGNVKMNP